MRTCLFRLKNPHGFDLIRFRLKIRGEKAIYCGSGSSDFSNGQDIYVRANCTMKASNTTNFGDQFENSKMINWKILFNREYDFPIGEIEILTSLEQHSNRLIMLIFRGSFHAKSCF
jgi:hypothetical protein